MHYCSPLLSEPTLVGSKLWIYYLPDSVEDHAVEKFKEDAREADPTVVIRPGLRTRLRHWRDGGARPLRRYLPCSQCLVAEVQQDVVKVAVL